MIKTREQSDRRNLTLLQSFRYHLSASLSKSNSISKVSTLYRGFWFSNIASLPAYGLYLGVYISSKDRLNASSNRSARFYAPFIAGALGNLNKHEFSSSYVFFFIGILQQMLLVYCFMSRVM